MSGEQPDIPEIPKNDELHDDIAQEDALIPAWFNWSFIATIVFGLIYIPFYILSGWSQEGQLAAEVAAAEEKYAAVRAAMPKENPYRGDAVALAAGQETWVAICAACHKPDGSGLVGPSLVDPYWKYGDDDAALYETVSEGRPEGMPPWAAQLGSEKIWQVLAYMETLPKSEEPGVGAPDYAPAGAPGG